MGFFDLAFLAVGLSMDAFAVSVCKGMCLSGADRRAMLLCGVWFGAFQALMPLLGFWLGAAFADAIQAVDHWVAFFLLAVIGVNMLKEAFSPDEPETDGDLSPKTMLILAVATSIDALAVGISLAMAGNVNILTAIGLIGGVTFGLSAAGVKVGGLFGSRFRKKAQLAGGLILMLLGAKILLWHLGVIA